MTDPETCVMHAVWNAGEIDARSVVEMLEVQCGYSASTVYTLIYRCLKKGLLIRHDPGFVLTAAVSREEVQDIETDQLADKLFEGSVDSLFAALVDRRRVSPEAIERMRRLIDEYEVDGPAEGGIRG